MRERPADVRDSDVAAALARQWALTVQDLSYLPVGFGGYHWLAVDQTGSRWGLDDIAEFLSEIRGPHQRTADTLGYWTGLRETLEAIAEGLQTP